MYATKRTIKHDPATRQWRWEILDLYGTRIGRGSGLESRAACVAAANECKKNWQKSLPKSTRKKRKPSERYCYDRLFDRRERPDGEKPPEIPAAYKEARGYLPGIPTRRRI
jgi:hypothetical protein